MDTCLRCVSAVVVLMLTTIKKLLESYHRRHGQESAGGAEKPTILIVSDLLADISFFIGFIVYPSVSSAVFAFFMKETFDGPGEDHVSVMRYDRSIETESTLYRAFMPYALIMLGLYPLGIPLQVGCRS